MMKEMFRSIFLSPNFWAVFIGIAIMGWIFYSFLGGLILGMLNTIVFVLKIVLNKVKSFLTFIFIESYMMIMFNIDSKNRGYDVSEYWTQRKFTVNGIFSKDVTGVEVLTINHPKLLQNVLDKYFVAKRQISNVLIFLKLKK